MSPEFEIYEPVLRPMEDAPRLKEDETNWRNGLLIRATNWLGDAMMTLPAVYKMSRFVPEPCGVFVVCPAGLAPLWRAAPWVSHVVELEGPRLEGLVLGKARGLRPGVGVVLPNSFGSALDLHRCHVPTRIGRRGRGRSLLLTHRVRRWARGKETADCHQLSHYLELARVLGEVPRDAVCPPLRVPDAGRVGERLGIVPRAGERWLGLAPGAAYGAAKQWPMEHFADVARWWSEEHGRCVVVGAAEEREIGGAIAERVDGVVNLTGQTDLRELMAVLSLTDLVAANDSGAMHLSAGLGIPGVAVFGSTDPVATGPLGAPWVLLRGDTDCGPCFQRTCSHQETSSRCLTRIPPERVCGALRQLLHRAVDAADAGRARGEDEKGP